MGRGRIENITKFLLLWAAVSAAIFALEYAGVWLDYLFNPWTAGLSLKWWNAFTTQHYWTWVFLKDPGTYYVASGASAAVFGFLVAIRFAAD